MFGDRSKATFFFRKSQELDARSKRASYTPSTEVVRLCIYMYLYLHCTCMHALCTECSCTFSDTT